jgi:hypothetical protein
MCLLKGYSAQFLLIAYTKITKTRIGANNTQAVRGVEQECIKDVLCNKYGYDISLRKYSFLRE